MRRFQMNRKTSYGYTPLTFPGRPTALPVNPITADVIAIIGGQGKHTIGIICENLEEVQLFWDLTDSGNLINLQWGILNKNP